MVGYEEISTRVQSRGWPGKWIS